jgi:PAS domain S-box-containing protein
MRPRDDHAIAHLESALLAGDEHFRVIADHANDLIGLLDEGGRRVYVNPAYERMFGTERRLLGGESFGDMHPDDRERMRAHFARLLATGSGAVAVFRFIARDGEVRHIESHASPVRGADGQVRLVIVVGRDVTERREAEEAMRARELQLREAQVIANIGSWEWNLEDRGITWSEHMYRVCGVDRETFRPSAEAFFELVHPEDRPRIMAAAERQARTGEVYDEPFRLVRPDGAVRWVQGRSHTDFSPGGQPLRIVGILQDITERYHTELQLRARDLQRESAHALANLGSWEIDLVTGDRTWSEQAYRVFGVDPSVKPSREVFLQLVHPEDRARVEAATREFPGTGLVPEEPFRIVRPDGAIRLCRSRGKVQHDASGKAVRVIGFCQDVTERAQATETLRTYAEQLLVTSRRVVEVQEAERRQLAAELHDRVGQNLTALGINLRLVEESLPPESRRLVAGTLRDSARLVEETVAVARDVMTGLRPQALDDYGLVVALRTLAAAFTKRTGIPVAIQAADRAARASRSSDLALYRIAQEGLNNVAKHAHATRVDIRYSESGDDTVLEIEDDGTGFDLERLERDGGWGLLIMRERAASIGATFDIHSHSGGGVQLRIALTQAAQ